MTSPNTRSRLDKILPRIQSPGFLQNRGRSNEIGFYVFDYPPSDELLVREHIAYLKRHLSGPGSSVNVVEVDLYEIAVELLEDRGILPKVPAEEARGGFEKVIQKLKRGVLKPGNFVSRIESKVAEDTNLVLLTGVGKAYPLLRSHTVLNNLHHPLGHMTVVMFFPGTYDQRELRLFGKFKDDNYYRAFRLVED